MHDVFVGRQPIYDDRLDVVAYELLFRADDASEARVADPDSATANVLLSALIEIGLENLVGNLPAFINFPRSFLVGKYPMPFENNCVVLEVLEDIPVDEELLGCLRRFAEQGCQIALDDFRYTPDHHPLLDIADIVKLDYQQFDRQALSDHVQRLRQFGPKLLVEKVETLQEYRLCRELGFDLFQGYFLSRPQVIHSRRISDNRAALLQLIAKLYEPDLCFSELERLVCRDLSLSFRLMRYVNSAALGLRKPVGSIHQAVLLLGIQRLRSLVTLMALASAEDSPPAVFDMALVRAKMCEVLGQKLNRSDLDSFFTVGLFSLLDIVMDVSLEEILRQLPLSAEVKGALLFHEGILGVVLRCTLAYECGKWDDACCLDLETRDIQEAYIEALNWSRQHSLAEQAACCPS